MLSLAQEKARPPKIADARCEACHEEIFRKYVTTPMANASGPSAEKFKTGTYINKSSGISYAFVSKNGQPVLSYQDTRNSQISGEWDLDFFLGSGHLGVTYLYSVNGYLFESPVAYYTRSQSMDMKPGLEMVSGMLPSLPMESSCLRCHMSAVRETDPGTLNHFSGQPFLHTGITCESCHGDTDRHVASGGKAPVVNPAKLDAARRDSICISCHLEGDISVERAGHSALAYKPGEPISDYLSYFVYKGKDTTRRGVSEVEQLNLSMCKRTSGEKLSCISCHDPHYTPTVQERAGFYRKRCLTCHNDAAFATSHHPENPDCTSCHMPANGAGNIPHVAWTDHRIRRTPDNETIIDLGEGEELTPIFSPGATKRDTALAYYHAVMEGNLVLLPKAYQMLEDGKLEYSADREALTALGILCVQRKDYTQASAVFEQVLKLDPVNLTALSNLGTLRAKSGDLQGAIPYLNKAFERNEDIVGLATNLSQVQCLTGDPAAARITLQKTSRYSPGLHNLQQMLAALSLCVGGR